MSGPSIQPTQTPEYTAFIQQHIAFYSFHLSLEEMSHYIHFISKYHLFQDWLCLLYVHYWLLTRISSTYIINFQVVQILLWWLAFGWCLELKAIESIFHSADMRIYRCISQLAHWYYHPLLAGAGYWCLNVTKSGAQLCRASFVLPPLNRSSRGVQSAGVTLYLLLHEYKVSPLSPCHNYPELVPGLATCAPTPPDNQQPQPARR